MRMERLGGLSCVVTGEHDPKGRGQDSAVILLHGFGAPGNDLVPLGQAIASTPGTRFVFPEAPLAVNLGFGESRAWWMLDIERRNREIAAGRSRDLSREVPPGLTEAREKVIALLDDVERRLRVAPPKTVLGGFSQGAMLSCDVALRTARPLAGLVLLSGSLLAQDEWVPLMPRRRGLPVLQSHGSADPVLPVFMAEQLRDLLIKGGLAVQWVGFRGGHEIPPVALDKLGAFLRRVLPG